MAPISPPIPEDRALHTPSHTSLTTLPNHPIFARLVRNAHHSPPRLAIRDTSPKPKNPNAPPLEATHLRLLTDVLALRNALHKTLDASVLRRLQAREAVYVAVLAPGGYEYAVGMLAVLALGAAAVPISVAVPADEGVYFVQKARAVAMLVAKSLLLLGMEIARIGVGDALPVVGIRASCGGRCLRPEELVVSSDAPLEDSAPGVVIFTSGTSGPPKGSVMRRSYVFADALGVADFYGLGEGDVVLHCLPVHHATGVGIMFFPALVAGAVIEFRSGGFEAAWIWDRWRKGGVSVFSGVPTIWMRLKRYFEEELARRMDVGDYLKGARELRVGLCGTSALPEPIAAFWKRILRRPILLRYGATEFGAVFRARLDDQNVPHGSVGSLAPGCVVRLSEGDEGEVLIKSPEMFSGYLFDPEATTAAHTPEGYFRSGDIARKEGDYYWILGRASVDIIKSGGYKISALDVEREILAQSYVSEVMVVGVPDEEFGQRVGAVVVTGKDGPRSLTINRLRSELRDKLAGYKMPTLLRVQENELPKSGTGKVVKKTLGPFLFPEDYARSPEVQVWRRADSKVTTAKPKL
ncbi:hypothetical protein MBLNU230_g2640t1 [Neophaeotheca triangularis]